ncbi:MAG: glucose-6-phosphate isomerase, partial [Salinisphaera sp.]|nr:glucose-6-phosphate isomerase [Salinisphaera sp.]
MSEDAAWRALRSDASRLAGCQLKDLFPADRERFARMSVQAEGLLLDYSKQRLTTDVVEHLLALAQSRGLGAATAAMFAGEPINRSEGRAAWHVALRAPPGPGYPPAVHETLDAMAAFAQQLRSGAWRGFRGDAITDVVNIGIGGSDLGPRLVCDALAEPGQTPRAHFVANVDPAELDDVLAVLDPARTLFVLVSKSFATAETLANAHAARGWLRAAGAGKTDISRHFVAVSCQREAVSAFGIEQRFGFWDWVGGRFSLWSSVGLVIALALGMDSFRALLAGAHAMDQHFRTAAPHQNLPVLLALTGIWNRNFMNLDSLVVVPYARRLRWFAAWLQQLEMESNGKSVGM